MELKKLGEATVRRICLALAIVAAPLESSAIDAREYFSNPQDLAVAEAAGGGDDASLDIALKNGGNPNAVGKDGMTPLIWALIKQRRRNFALLLDHGSDPNRQLDDGRSAISLAAMHEDPWYLSTVLSHRGDPNLVNHKDNDFTPIFYAIFAGRRDFVELLVKATANLNQLSSFGESPILAAAATNQYDIVLTLLDAGADPRIGSIKGRTLLSVIRITRANPSSKMGILKNQVIKMLQGKGMDVVNGL